MAGDMNQCLFTGRLGADPESRSFQNGNRVVNLRLAVSDKWKDKASGERKESTEWVSVAIFSEGLCKVAMDYLRKGSRVLLQGQWKVRKWTDQAGNDRYSTELVLQGFDAKLQLLDPPSGSSANSANTGWTGQSPQQPSADEFSSADLDDDLPF